MKQESLRQASVVSVPLDATTTAAIQRAAAADFIGRIEWVQQAICNELKRLGYPAPSPAGKAKL